MGYEHIKIYNGGIKDWKKSGYALDVLEALPEYDARFISAEELSINLKKAEQMNCAEGQPGLMLLDLRVENFLKPDLPFLSIRTSCPTFACLLDDLRKPEVRQRIPRKGLVVVVTETGNRDIFAMKYLSKFGYTNLVGLRFGMRGWIKSDYPVKSSQ